jgi:hypothetical protein
MRLIEEIFSWKISFLSLENLYLTTQNTNKIVVNRMNQGMS